MTVTGNELPVTLGTQQPSYSIGTGTDKTCVTPDTTTSDATPAALITPSGASNPVATLFANTSASVDTVLRPTPTGVETLEQIRNSSAPQTFVWDVGLHDGQQLESLPNGDVAVINGPDTQTPPSPSWTPPSDLPDNSGASQLPLSPEFRR